MAGLGGYVALIAPVRFYKGQKIVGGVLIALSLGITTLVPEPVRLDHPEGWVLIKDAEGQLINSGYENIRPFDFTRAKTLWHQDAWPDAHPENPGRQHQSRANQTTGSILTYSLFGKEWTVNSLWFNRRTEADWIF